MSKFRKGDYVRCKSNCGICCDDVFIREGQILKIESDETCFRTYDVSFTSNVIARVHYDDMELVSRPSDDPKTAFLTELKDLMEKYGVEISLIWPSVKTMQFKSKDFAIHYELSATVPITPENIFDYDK